MGVLKCLEFGSSLEFKVSFFVTLADEFVFKFLFAESLDFSIYLSESLVLLNAIVQWEIHDQSAVVVVALVKIPANDPLEDALELEVVYWEAFGLIDTWNFSEVNFEK